jgi:hypothetical protein
MRRLLSFVLVVVGVGLMAWAGHALWRDAGAQENEPTGGLHIEEADIDLGEVPIRQDYSVTTRVHNPSHRPARILNVAQGCAEGFCFRSIDGPEPVLVSAGSTVEYSWLLSVPDVGPFEGQVPLYVDDGGLRTITLTVRGKGVAGADDVPPK